MRWWLTYLVAVVCVGQGGALATTGTGMSPKLQEGLRLYESGKYHEASTRLHDVVDGSTLDSQKNKERAELFLGKALYHLGFYTPSKAFFERIAQKPANRYHVAAVKWLVAIDDKLPEPAGVGRTLGKYRVDLLKERMLVRLRDELRYILGRHHYRQGSFQDATRLLRAVDPKSKLYLKARFLEGVTHVRRYKARPAAAAFKDVLRAARKAPATKEKKRLTELAQLNLARLFYSTRQYRQAVKYFQKIPSRSKNRPAALMELSWALYQTDAHRRALQALKRARRARGDPETHLLEAVIYHKNCLYRRSRGVAQRFEKAFVPLRKKLVAFLKKHRDPSDFHDLVPGLRAGKAKLGGQLDKLVRTALADGQLTKSLGWVQELRRELKMVQSAPPSWKATAVAGVVLQDLTLQFSLARNEAGQLAQRRIQRLVSELQSQLEQARKVALDSAALLKKGNAPAGCNLLGKSR